jgi:hypothetical protein
MTDGQAREGDGMAVNIADGIERVESQELTRAQKEAVAWDEYDRSAARAYRILMAALEDAEDDD